MIKLRILVISVFSTIAFCSFSAIKVIQPKNSVVLNDTVVFFQWNSVDNALNYTIAIANNSDFTGSTEYNNITLTQKTISLEGNATYYWKIKPDNGPWSEVYSFTLFDPADLAITSLWLRADSNVVFTNDSLVLNWTDISHNNIIGYQNTLNQRPYQKNNIKSLNNNSVIRFDGVDDKISIDSFITIKTAFIIANWNGIEANFPSYNALLDRKTYTAAFWNFLFVGIGGQSKFLSNGLFGTDTYINQIQTTEFAPLNQYKLISGKKDNSYSFDLNMGNSASAGGRVWKGDIAEVLLFNEVLSDSILNLTYKYLQSRYAPPINLGANISIPYGFADTTINAHKPWFTNYTWLYMGDTISNDSAININKAGYYKVIVTDIFGFNSSDSVMVTYPTINYPTTGADTTICLGDTLVWNTQLTGDYIYSWSNEAANNNYLLIDTTGIYALRITDNKGNYRDFDTITVYIDSFPLKNSLGPDRSVCKYEAVCLTAQGENIISYLWNTGATNSYINIENPGDYSITVTNIRGCHGSDTANYIIAGEAPTVLFKADTICFGDSTSFTNLTTITAPDVINSYSWDFGNDSVSNFVNPKHLYQTPDTFVVTLTAIALSGCSSYFSDSVVIRYRPSAGFTIDYGVHQCTGTPVHFNDTAVSLLPIVSYEWNFDNGDTSANQNPDYTYLSAGNYLVHQKITAQNGCPDSTSLLINISDERPLPYKFNLVAPEQNAYLSSPLPTLFSWQESINAISYQFEIAKDSLFSQSYFTTTIDSLSIEYTIPVTGVWYWQVNAFNICGDYTKSELYSIAKTDPSLSEHLQIWLSADQGIVSSDSVINHWNDISGNTKNAYQNNTEFSPIIIERVLNGYPAVRFDGVNDYMFIDSSLKIGSLFIIVNWFGSETVFPGYNGIINEQSGSTSQSILYTGIQGFSTFASGFFGDSITINQTKTKNFAPLNQYKLIYGKNSSPRTFPNLVLGRDRNTTDRYWKGDIIEVLIYDTILSDEEKLEVENYLRYKYAPPVNLPQNINIAYGFPDTTLSAHKPWFTSYRWSINGDTISYDSALIVNQSGTYTVEVTDIFGFTSRDSITVSYPKPQQIASAELCRYDTLLWDPQLTGNYSFEWSSGQSTPVLPISEPGDYWLIIRDSLGNAWHSDTITVSVDEFPKELSLGADTTFCLGNRLYVQNEQDEVQSYLWSDGSSLDYLQPETSGAYSLTATNALGCVGIDTVNITISGIAPLPDFSVTQLCHKDSALFADLSLSPDGSDIVNWVWDFGDGTQSDEKAPEHRYEDAGEYVVSLSIRNELLCSNSLQKTVVIHALPQAAFTPLTACSNTPVSFSDNSLSTSGEVNQWQWTFPDGSVQTLASPEFTFVTAGAHPVLLVVRSDLGCYDTLVQNIDIKPGPLGDFSFGPTCQGLPVAFSDQSISFLNLPLEYSWDFGDGTGSNLSSPEKSFADTGNYQVSLRTTQTSNHCSSIVSKTLWVNPNPTARFELPVTCVNAPVVFTDLSESNSGTISEWVWKIDSLGTIRKQTPSLSFAYPGTYHINLSVTDNRACSDSAGATLTVHPLPIARFETSINKGPVPLVVSFNNESQGAAGYLWDFGDGAGSEETHPQHTYVDSGSYTVQLSATSAEGCNASFFGSIRGIVPRVDLQVLDLKTEISSGYLKVRALLQNQGTLDLEQIVLQLHAQGSQPLREELKTTLYSGQTYLHEFATQLPLDANNPLTHICVNAFDLAYTDEFLENNEICLALEDAFKMLPSYPNPAEDYLVVEYLIPVDARLSISLYDANGKIKAVLYDAVSGAGFNRHRFNIADLGPGVYFYKISYKGTQHSRTFVVN